ncbi:MAG: ribose-phosphate pyrophosphokinase [Candidatus Chisholmbacteria bacterium]|nr:ribose-phosphate pyrophosphokinase [Candidatus Chisholmbacteria bacterium]
MIKNHPTKAVVLSGSAHPKLARELAELLHLKVAATDISYFPNGEKRIWVKDKLAGKVVVIVQPFSAPVDEHIVEFCLLLDAAHHLKAQQVVGVVPWLGYSPQDKLFREGEPISVHVVAKMIESLNLNHLVVADIHSADSLKHFTVPVTQVSAAELYINHFKKLNLKNHLAVALDKGATKRAHEFARALKLPLVQFEKSRDRKTGAVTFKSLKDGVRGKHVISFDDFVSTGTTRIQASSILKQKGALSYTDCITHALLAGQAPKKLQASSIDRLYTTDSYPIPKAKLFPKLTILHIAPLLAKAIKPLIK